MKKRRRTLAIVLVLLIGGAAVLLAQFVGSEAFLRRLLPRNRHQVLFETDLPLLLSACRQVIEQRERFSPASHPEKNTLRQGWYMPDVDDGDLPEILRSLNPSYVVVSQDRLRAELYHCTDLCAHFGIVAFRAGVVPELPTDLIDADAYGYPGKSESLDQMAVRMAPGLWFYDTRLTSPLLQRRLQEFLHRQEIRKGTRTNEMSSPDP